MTFLRKGKSEAIILAKRDVTKNCSPSAEMEANEEAEMEANEEAEKEAVMETIAKSRQN